MIFKIEIWKLVNLSSKIERIHLIQHFRLHNLRNFYNLLVQRNFLQRLVTPKHYQLWFIILLEKKMVDLALLNFTKHLHLEIQSRLYDKKKLRDS